MIGLVAASGALVRVLAVDEPDPLLDDMTLTQVAVPAGYLSGAVEWDEGTQSFVEAPLLARAKANAAVRVNAEAGAFRGRFITIAPGQEATYLRKEDEARRYDTSGGAGDYPFLSAEAAATGDTLAAVAELVLTTANQWVPLGAAIEGQRRAALKNIALAATLSEVAAAAAVDWEAILS